MKTNLIKMLAALSLVASVGANLAVAQEKRVEANVPFAFYMGDQKLPAGRYQAKTIPNGSTMILRNAETGAGAISITMGTGGNTKAVYTKLVFEKINDSYFLHQVWAGTNVGSQLPQSKARREFVAKNARTESVVVAAE